MGINVDNLKKVHVRVRADRKVLVLHFEYADKREAALTLNKKFSVEVARAMLKQSEQLLPEAHEPVGTLVLPPPIMDR